MADKRMFSKKLISSDAFRDMPLSTQGLFFQLCMEADDDGIVDNPNTVARACQASKEDMQMLKDKRYILTFDNSNVIVIKHWKMHNTIPKDRYHPSTYSEELSTLTVKENGSYTEKNRIVTDCKQIVTKPDTACKQSDTEPQPRLDKIREDKISNNIPTAESENTPIPYTEIIAYLNERAGTKFLPSTVSTKRLIKSRFNENPSYTVDDFKKVIDNKVADWKDTERQRYLRPETLFGAKFESYLNEKPTSTKPRAKPSNNRFNSFKQRNYNFDALEKQLLSKEDT